MLLLCLEIDTIECCYLLPAILQVAHYCGDSELTYVCNHILKQTKQQIYATYELQFWKIKNNGERGHSRLPQSSLSKLLTSTKERHSSKLIVYNTILCSLLPFQSKRSFDWKEEQRIAGNNQLLERYLQRSTNTQRLEQYLLSRAHGKPKAIHTARQDKESRQLLSMISQTLLANPKSVLVHTLFTYRRWKATIWWPSLAKASYEDQQHELSSYFVQLAHTEQRLSAYVESLY